MNVQEFDAAFARLEHHFRIDPDDRATIFKDWFAQLAHYHIDAVSNAVDEVIRDATDTFWPALGKITNAIKSKLTRYEHVRRECLTCHGNLWIEGMPWKSNGMVYTGYQRCPDCGVPPPNYTPPPYREPLTATEYAQWLAGTLPQPEMPVSRSHPIVKQALDIIRKQASMKPIAQSVNVEKAISEPGELG